MTRRNFLTATAAAVATGFAAAPCVATAAALVVGSNERIRVGVIGAGTRGMQLVRGAMAKASALNLELAAVCDVFEPRKSMAKKISGADFQHHWQKVIARNDIDAVIIATPNHWHAPMAIAAMQMGKDVYCETPMAHTIGEAKAFRDTALATKRIVQIGAQTASEPRWHAAKELIAGGKLGAIMWCQESHSRPASDADSHWSTGDATSDTLDWNAFLGAAPKTPFSPDRFFQWRNYWDYSGGVATDRLYDSLAGLQVALGHGFPERVSAAGGVYAQNGREVPDSFVMTCEYPGKRRVVLATAATNTNELPAIIRGHEATLYLGEKTLTLEAEAEHRDAFAARFGNGDRIEMPFGEREGHLENFVRCMRTRDKCVCNENVSYQCMVAIGMGVKAYREGATLYFDPAQERVSANSSRLDDDAMRGMVA